MVITPAIDKRLREYFEKPDKSIQSLARELDIAEKTIYRWKDRNLTTKTTPWGRPFPERKSPQGPPKPKIGKSRKSKSRQDRLNDVTKIADRASQPSVKLKALEMLHEWERDSGQQSGLGDPLSSEERIERAKLVLSGLSQDEAQEALRRAFAEPSEPISDQVVGSGDNSPVALPNADAAVAAQAPPPNLDPTALAT